MESGVVRQSRKASRTAAFRKAKRHWQLYAFMLLPVTYIIIFEYAPMPGIQIAFKKFDYALGIWGSHWVGFDNFLKFFKSYMFSRVMVNTLRISLFSLIAGFPIPILFALALNCVNRQRYKKAVQTITYMPHFISTVVMVGMIIQVLNPRVGLYGYISRLITGAVPQDLLINPDLFLPIYITSGVWQGFGWGSILYMAALTSVSAELHEAAQIDGATRLRRIIHIDLPAILPTVIISLILASGGLMNVGFDKVFLLQNHMNLRVSEVISTYVYKRSLGGGSNADFSFSTAVGFFNNVINIAMLIVVNRIAASVSETSLW